MLYAEKPDRNGTITLVGALAPSQGTCRKAKDRGRLEYGPGTHIAVSPACAQQNHDLPSVGSLHVPMMMMGDTNNVRHSQEQWCSLLPCELDSADNEPLC
jgi:hypothetical protein